MPGPNSVPGSHLWMYLCCVHQSHQPSACRFFRAHTPARPLSRGQGDAKRLLLSSLTKSLGEVLPFLERMLELNFGAAGAAAQAGNREAAQQHVLVIQAALQAANTYSGASGGACGGLGIRGRRTQRL